MKHQNKEIQTVRQVIEVIANWIEKNIVRFAPTSYEEGFAKDWAMEQFAGEELEGWAWVNKRFPARLIQLLTFYQTNFIKTKRPNEQERDIILMYIGEFIRVGSSRDAEGLKAAFRSFTRPLSKSLISEDGEKLGKRRLSHEVDLYSEFEYTMKLNNPRRKK